MHAISSGPDAITLEISCVIIQIEDLICEALMKICCAQKAAS